MVRKMDCGEENGLWREEWIVVRRMDCDEENEL